MRISKLLAVVLALALLNVLVVIALGVVGGRAAVHLASVSDALRRLGDESIETTVRIRKTVPIEAELEILEPVGVDLTMDVRGKVPVRLRVKVDEKLQVPIDLPIHEEIVVDDVPVRLDETKVRVQTDIKFERPVKWKVASPFAPVLNITGSVPLDQGIRIAFPQAVRVSGKIPVKFPLRETLLVPVSFDVPVDDFMDLDIPIKQRAVVGFPEPLKIRGDFPVAVEIPVRIPLRETVLAKYLDQIAEELRAILPF